MTRLVGYGCSFTAGTELSDHILLNQPREVVDSIKRKFGHGSWQKILDHFGFKEDPKKIGDSLLPRSSIINSMPADISPYRCYDINETDELVTGEDINRSLTWVRYLAELRGHSHYKNRGIGGSSLEHVLWHLHEDIINGSIDLEKDEIIIQVPHPYRLFSFRQDGNSQSVMPSGLFHGFEKNESPVNLANFNSFNVTWRYYRDLKTLNALGIPFFFLEVPPRLLEKNMHYDEKVGGGSIDRNVDVSWMDKCWDWIVDNSLYVYSGVMRWPFHHFFYGPDHNRHGWLHYFTEEHIKIAEKLNDKLGN